MRRLIGLCLGISLVAGASLALGGCAQQAPEPVQQQVSIAQAPPPPSPPTGAELEKPPNVVLERPTRDPFIPVIGNGGAVAVTTKGEEGKKGAAVTPVAPAATFSVTGIVYDHDKTAILNTGTNSYIVHTGDKVDGYRVGTITPKGVVLIGKGGKLSLSLVSGQ